MITTKEQLDRLYLAVLERPRSAGEGEDVYLGKDSGWVFDDLYKSAERARRLQADATIKDQANKAVSLDAQLKLAQTQNESLTKTVTTMQGHLDNLSEELADADDANADLKRDNESLTIRQGELGKAITSLTKQNKELQASVTATNRDSNQLNALGNLLKWFITRLGIK